MFVCVSCTGNLRAGDIMILEYSADFGEVVAKMLGGVVVGFVTDRQPDGCLSKSFAERKIGRRRVIGRAVVLNGNVALFYSESPIFSETSSESYAQRLYRAV